jgi:hypothetical protein
LVWGANGSEISDPNLKPAEHESEGHAEHQINPPYDVEVEVQVVQLSSAVDSGTAGVLGEHDA